MNAIRIIENVPDEIRNSLKLLSDDTRLAIVLTLLKDGTMSFSELSSHLGIRKNVLSHHLKILVQAALIKNYYQKNDCTDYSFYETTSLSRDFIDRLFGVMEPVTTDVLANIFLSCRMATEGTGKFEIVKKYVRHSNNFNSFTLDNQPHSFPKMQNKEKVTA